MAVNINRFSPGEFPSSAHRKSTTIQTCLRVRVNARIVRRNGGEKGEEKKEGKEGEIEKVEK